jgi:hypothetical protein
MPRVSIDLTEAQSRKPIPDGTYSGEIKAFEGPTRGPKSTYLTAIIEIDEGEHKGRKFYHNLPITGAGAGIFADFYSKVTGEEVDVDDLDKMDVDTDDLVGSSVGFTTKQEEYPEGSGEFQSKIVKVLKAR